MSGRKRGRRQGWEREKMERETGVGERENRDWRKRKRERETGMGEREREKGMSMRKKREKIERESGCER